MNNRRPKKLATQLSTTEDLKDQPFLYFLDNENQNTRFFKRHLDDIRFMLPGRTGQAMTARYESDNLSKDTLSRSWAVNPEKEQQPVILLDQNLDTSKDLHPDGSRVYGHEVSYQLRKLGVTSTIISYSSNSDYKGEDADKTLKIYNQYGDNPGPLPNINFLFQKNDPKYKSAISLPEVLALCKKAFPEYEVYAVKKKSKNPLGKPSLPRQLSAPVMSKSGSSSSLSTTPSPATGDTYSASLAVSPFSLLPSPSSFTVSPIPTILEKKLEEPKIKPSSPTEKTLSPFSTTPTSPESSKKLSPGDSSPKLSQSFETFGFTKKRAASCPTESTSPYTSSESPKSPRYSR